MTHAHNQMDTHKPFVYTCQWLQGVVVLLHRLTWMPSTECSVLVKHFHIQCSLNVVELWNSQPISPWGIFFFFLNQPKLRGIHQKCQFCNIISQKQNLEWCQQYKHKNYTRTWPKNTAWLWLYKWIISLACAIVLRLHASEKPWTDPISIFCFLLVSWSTGKVGCCFKL